MHIKLALVVLLSVIAAGVSGCSKKGDGKADLKLHALGTPEIRTCVKIVKCEDGTNPLTEAEKEQFAKLMSQINVATTEAQISANHTLLPDGKGPAIPMPGFSSGTTMTKIQWYAPNQDDPPNKAQTPLNSHIDVYFINDQIFKFAWWTDGLQKSVMVTFMG